MEDFVREMIKKSDLSVLTTKAVRKAYESHLGQPLSSEGKQSLKELVNSVLEELAKNMKAASPQKSPPPPSPKVTPQKLSPTKTIHSEQSPSKTLRKSPRATQKKSYNVDSDEDEKNEKESLPNGKRKQKEIDEDFDAETIDFESEEESENRLNGNENTAQSAEASSVKSSKKKTAKHKSPMKPGKAKKKQIVSNSETESYQDKIDTDSVSEIAPDSSVNNKSKSSKTMKTGDSVKKRRSLNVKDAVQAVLDSDMDTYSVVSSESGSDDDRLVITIKKNRKRKLTSDDDNSEYSVSTKKRASKSKKKSPKKPPSKKAKIESESESEVSSHQTSPRKSPPKKPSSDSEDSGDDRLQIDVGIDSEEEDGHFNQKTADMKTTPVVSSDSEMSVNLVSPVKTGKGKKAAGPKSSRGGGKYGIGIAELRKICRCAGIILRNTIELFGCTTDDEKKSRILDILREKGMEGRPTMSKAEKLKLKKEAAELDTENIISESGRPKRRRVGSKYRTGVVSPSPSPVKKATPLKEKFRGLKGIIDSEGSESD